MKTSAIKSEPVTELLNNWVVHSDLESANQLRSIIYYHLKGVVKKQITNKSTSKAIVAQLPNTTSLLHEAIVQLTPPTEIFDNREQYFASLASLIRWILLDDLKAQNAKKRIQSKESITDFIPIHGDPEPYISFDNALSKLEKIAPRTYQVAMLHYFLGYDVPTISAELTIQKSTIYTELSAAKAYLRTQCQMET